MQTARPCTKQAKQNMDKVHKEKGRIKWEGTLGGDPDNPFPLKEHRIYNEPLKELWWSLVENKGFWGTLGFLTALALFVFYLFVRTR